MFKDAFMLRSDAARIKLMRQIGGLGGIPKGNRTDMVTDPSILLTPVFFALDRDLRFPIINKKKEVQALLRQLDASNKPLGDQCAILISLYGRGGISDAVDLDQADAYLLDFANISVPKDHRSSLNVKAVDGHALPLKDERDYRILQIAGERDGRRIHNSLTNKLRDCLKHLVLEEGGGTAMFDVGIKNYNGKDDYLLVEAKSSADPAQIRMAIGQLYDYWYRLHGDKEPPHLAVLLPEAPAPLSEKLLTWLGIGILWFSDNKLETNSQSLVALVKAASNA
jgi:hypothetical protein